MVLQGTQYTHLQYSLYVTHPCDKEEEELEGGCDFIVMGTGFVALFDVRAPADDLFANHYKLSQSQRNLTLKLVRRCCIKTFRFKMPEILEFGVFVSITKADAEQLSSYTALSEKEKNCLLFKDELSRFSEWWSNRMPAANTDSEFDSALERVKQTLIGIWSVNSENVSELNKCDLSHTMKVLRGQSGDERTIELELKLASIKEQALKSGLENGFPTDNSFSTPVFKFNGPRPSLHVVVRKNGEDSVNVSLRSVIESELQKISFLDCKAVITPGTALCNAATSTAQCPVLNFQSDLGSRKFTAVICVIDLLEVLRLSSLRSGKLVEFSDVLFSVYSAAARATSYCCFVLVLGATEVDGEPGFEDFGTETLNKKNRTYFAATKEHILKLLETLASQSRCTWHSTNSVPRFDCKEMLKSADSLYSFPDKQLNQGTVNKISDQSGAVEKGVARLAEIISVNKKVTDHWTSRSSCSNAALIEINDTLVELFIDVNTLTEVNDALTSQIQDLKQLYEEMKGEVIENID